MLHSPTDPAACRGVWTRQSIRWPDGSEDRTTRVWWVQTRSAYADLRLPINAPSFKNATSLQTCEAAQLAYLRSQQGFAGVLRRVGEHWIWDREIDYSPPTGKRDIGTLRYVDESKMEMIEEGVDEEYTEVWRQIGDPAAPSLALRRKAATSRAILAAAGGHFILAIAIGREVEISHGLSHGPIETWTIANSTAPWRCGKRAFTSKPIHSDQTWEVIDDQGAGIWL